MKFTLAVLTAMFLSMPAYGQDPNEPQVLEPVGKFYPTRRSTEAFVYSFDDNGYRCYFVDRRRTEPRLVCVPLQEGGGQGSPVPSP